MKVSKGVTKDFLKKQNIWYPSGGGGGGDDIQWELVRYPMGDLQKLHPREVEKFLYRDCEGNPQQGGACI